MKTQLQETYRERWQGYFEQALEDRGFSPDLNVTTMSDTLFDMCSDRADELLADDEASRIDAVEVTP